MSEPIWNYTLIDIFVFSIIFIQFFILINYICHSALGNPIQAPDDCANLKIVYFATSVGNAVPRKRE